MFIEGKKRIEKWTIDMFCHNHVVVTKVVTQSYAFRFYHVGIDRPSKWVRWIEFGFNATKFKLETGLLKRITKLMTLIQSFMEQINLIWPIMKTKKKKTKKKNEQT